jgi:hypothetical protein
MIHKLKDWGWRYIPAEISGTLTALLAALIVTFLTNNPILTAFAGTWGENIGFYGIILIREFKTKKNNSIPLRKTLRNLIIEFGPAEVLDSFVLRPFFMFIFPTIIGNLVIGIIIGKFAADATFYIPTIIAYELRKKHLD